LDHLIGTQKWVTEVTSAYPTESLKSAPQPTPAGIGVMTAQAAGVLDAGLRRSWHGSSWKDYGAAKEKRSK